MGETRVVNIRKEPFDVYIGRPGKGQGGPFGNPFRVGIHGTREECISQYRAWFLRKVYNDREFDEQIRSLRGKRLGCFCSPEPCHGDVIVEWLNEND